MFALDDQQLAQVLFGVSLLTLGGAVVSVYRGRKEARLVNLRALGEVDQVKPGAEQKLDLASTLGRVGQVVSSGKTSTTLREKLARAGFYSESASGVYMGYKLVLFLVGLVGLGALFSATKLPVAVMIPLAVAGAGIFFFLPNLFVALQYSKRRRLVKAHLPDAIDLLDICVSSGMGLDTAWKSVAEEIRRVCPILANEMELTNLEISLGTKRPAAMRNMAERTGADEVSSLVALLVQSERFGASIVEALKTFAKTMRETRTQKIEEAAEKMAIKLLFPMVIFIFPPLLIVMAGPAVVSFLNVVGGR